MRPNGQARKWLIAVGVSLGLHGLALHTWWEATRRHGAVVRGGVSTIAPSVRASAMVWITAPVPPAAVAAPDAGSPPAPRAHGPSARARPVAVASGARQARTVAPAQAVEPDPVAHAPSTPASESAPPLHWGPEDLRRAAQDDGAQERRWGRIVPHQRWTAETAHNGQAGDNVRLSEQHAVGGGRVTRVQRGGAVYCVEIPSTNQPPAMGAAPRMALPRTCS
jgi:hypothetical protein